MLWDDPPSTVVPWRKILCHTVPGVPYSDGTPKKAAQSTAVRRSSTFASANGRPGWIKLPDWHIPHWVWEKPWQNHWNSKVPAGVLWSYSRRVIALTLPHQCLTIPQAGTKGFIPLDCWISSQQQRCHHEWTPTIWPFDPVPLFFLTTKKHTDNLQECLTNVHSFCSQPFESHIEKNKKLPLPWPVHRHHRLLILCRTTLWTRSMRPVKSLVNHEGYMITPKWMVEIGWILSINNTDSRTLPSVAACLWQKFSKNF